jgi:predicted nucleic acid-binding protein
MAVIDSSVLVNALADGGDDGKEARNALRSHETLVAPDLLDVETVSGLRRQWKQGRLTDDAFKSAVNDLQMMPIDRLPSIGLLSRAYELRHTVSSYDAMYVALAEALNRPLVTADQRLASANGPRCSFEVLGR